MDLYHGTPCGAFERNRDVFANMHLCMSWAAYATSCKGKRTGTPTPSALRHALACRKLLLDNGAFSVWQQARKRCAVMHLDVAAIYAWMTAMIEAKAAADGYGCIILLPDVIEGSEEENDALLRTCPEHLRPVAWPVWHMTDSLDRLARLSDEWGAVAIGACGPYTEVLGPEYCRRIDQVFDDREARHSGSRLHMLRGLQVAAGPWPFTSADSTDVGQNWSQTPHRLQTRVACWERRARATPATWNPPRHRICWASTARENRKILARQDALWPVEQREAAQKPQRQTKRQPRQARETVHERRQIEMFSRS